MQDSFFQAVCRVGIFMICAQAVVHFRPQEAYEKYLKLLVGIMVMIQLFWPIGDFLLGGRRQEAADMLEQFRQGLMQGMAEAEKRTAEAEAVLEQMTLEELRRYLAQQEESAEKSGEGSAGEAQEQEAGLNGDRIDTGKVTVDVEPVEPVEISSPVRTP